MKLHLGCGDDYRPGFVNVDRGRCRADLHHDLNLTPYPFADDQFELVVASQVLEHLDKERWFAIIRELHRISMPNALWEFRSAYALSDNFATDPTHRMALAPRSFDYFDPAKPLGRFGAIYGLDCELRVLVGKLVRADRYGPDVYHVLLVTKPDKALVKVPAILPQYLYQEESLVRGTARAVARHIPGVPQLSAWLARRS